MSDTRTYVQSQKAALDFLLSNMANQRGTPAYEERMRLHVALAKEVLRRLDLMAEREALLEWIK